MPLIEILQRGELDVGALVTWLLALALGITVHEFAHAYRADRAGDPTPRAHGRVSLNPLDHYDPVGTTLILLFGFGWGKPVPVNANLFRHPRRDEIMVSLWGPLSNLIVATLLAIPVRLGLAGEYTMPLVSIIRLQVVLAVFNLIPIYPLDGSHILSALLPVPQARRLDALYHQYGPLMLMAFILGAGWIVWPIVATVLGILLGV